MLAAGIETAFVPSDSGGGEYLVRAEPPGIAGVPTHLPVTSADVGDVRRVCIYAGDKWPAAVERTVIEAAKQPRVSWTNYLLWRTIGRIRLWPWRHGLSWLGLTRCSFRLWQRHLGILLEV